MALDMSAEKAVNTTAAGGQSAAAIATLSDGSYVIVWMSEGQDGSGSGIYQQHFSATGVPIGAEKLVNTVTANDQVSPAIAALKDGEWVVGWTDNKADNSTPGVYLQRFAADGTAKAGGQVKVNTYETSSQKSPVIAAQADGSFVVTWMSESQDGDSWGVYQQRYDAAGAKAGTEVVVNQQSSKAQISPATTRLADGTVIMTWASFNQDGDGYGIYQRAYKANGDSIGQESVVNTTTKAGQTDPAIAATSEGWVVTWVSETQDGSGLGIYQQAWKMVGTTPTKIGTETLVNKTTEGQQFDPAVTGLADGSWVVTWSGSDASDGSISIYQQRFLADGSRHGEEIQVAEMPAGAQIEPVVTALKDGGWVVAWTGADGSGTGIRSRTFHIINEAPVIGTPIPDTLVLAASAGSGTTSQVVLDGAAFTDPNGETLTWTLTRADGSALPSWLEFDAKTHTILSKAGPAEVGTIIALKATATDKAGLAVSDTFNLTVLQTNAAPVVAASIGTLTALEDTAFSFTVPSNAFADADGHALHYSATLDGGDKLPAWLTFNAQTLTFSGTPADADTGTLSVRLFATDTLAKVSQVITITVGKVNDAPAGKDATLTMLEEAELHVTAQDFGFSDTDKNALKAVEITSLPKAGALMLGNKPVVAGAIIPVADLEKLVYTAPEDLFGANAARLGFKVIDDGGTDNGGIDKDPTERFLSITITDMADNRTGNGKANKLSGDDGIDIIDGRGGRDRLTGENGADVFVFSDKYGRDTIIDFQATGEIHDRIRLSGLDDVDSFSDLAALMEQAGSHVRIEAGHGDVLILRNTHLADLDETDFIF